METADSHDWVIGCTIKVLTKHTKEVRPLLTGYTLQLGRVLHSGYTGCSYTPAQLKAAP